MCGLVGFFNGCDLKVRCPRAIGRACSADNTSAASFASWTDHASVRAKPYPSPAPVELPGLPAEFVPVLHHTRLRALPQAQRHLLRGAALFRFLNFTHRLEMMVVNTVTANIALGRYDFELPATMRRDAHRIYVDEAYHALFSFEHMQALQNRLPSAMARERQPRFLTALERLRNDLDRRQALLLEMFFVIISEMLITTTLKSAHARDDIAADVRDMLVQHAQDEARHHIYYRALLGEIWPQMNADDQDFILRSTPALLLTYCVPDLEAMKDELTYCGLSAKEACRILAETYPHEATARYAQEIGRSALITLAGLATQRQSALLSEATDHHLMFAQQGAGTGLMLDTFFPDGDPARSAKAVSSHPEYSCSLEDLQSMFTDLGLSARAERITDVIGIVHAELPRC